MKTPFQQQVQQQQQQIRRQQEGYYWLQQQEAARRAREQAARRGQPPSARPLPGRGDRAYRPRGAAPEARPRRRPIRATLFFLIALPVVAWVALAAHQFLLHEMAVPEEIALVGGLAVAFVGFVLDCRWTGRIWRGRRRYA